MQRDPDRQGMEKAYARWAPVYDALCGPVFVNGRRAAARAAREVGGQILEIGVGTTQLRKLPASTYPNP
jgi:phosphatidylethanolamine/phosphatidyl-N-methylethanolamine N-methyltransferase